MLWDTHMHTHHSGDSDALMPDMIQAAVRQNLDGICFTDHFDYDYPDDPNLFLLDFDSYIKEVRSFQDTCRDRLSIRLGIEVGLQPHITEINRKAVTGHPFDFCHRVPPTLFTESIPITRNTMKDAPKKLLTASTSNPFWKT